MRWVLALIPVVSAPPASPPPPSPGLLPHAVLLHGSVSWCDPQLGLSVLISEVKKAWDSQLDKTGSHHGSQLSAPWPQFTHLETGAFVKFKVCKSLAHCLAYSEWIIHTC